MTADGLHKEYLQLSNKPSAKTHPYTHKLNKLFLTAIYELKYKEGALKRTMEEKDKWKRDYVERDAVVLDTHKKIEDIRDILNDGSKCNCPDCW